MAGECVEKIVHDKCGSNNLQVFLNEDGKYTGFCFGCGKFVHDPYHDKPKDYKPVFIRKTPEQIAEEIAEISEYQTVALPERKLQKWALEYFGVKIGLSQEDGVTPVSHHYPYFDNSGALVGYKNRIIENKRMWSMGDLKRATFFGWEQAKAASGKTLYITEGECDAVALYQILKDANKAKIEYKDLNPPIVSLPKGSGHAASALAEMLPEIRKYFKDIVLVFDMDDAGENAVRECLKIVPEARVASLPVKDVNDGLISGREKAVKDAVLFKAETPKNTRLVQGASLHVKAKEPPKWGFKWPWKGINELTRGIRLGETIYFGAAQKMGKSEVVNALAAYFIQELDWPVFMVKPEESNEKTYKMVAGKIAGRKFHDPKVEFDEAEFDRAGEIIGNKLFLLNLYQELSWEVLEGDIRAAAQAGCKAIFIDPITNLTNGMSASDANTELQKIAQKLAALALDLNVVILIFCHLRNPDSGTPHERGGEVLSSQFAGSRAMARSCNLMVGIEGNRDPALTEEERNFRDFVILENRETGEVGRFRKYWNPVTTLFTEVGK